MSTRDTTTPPSTLTPAAIAAIESAASAQFGLRLKYVPEDQPEQPKQKPQQTLAKEKKPPTNKPASKEKKPPTGPELEELILKDLDGRSSTCATRFYSYWPESDHKKAKAAVSNAFGRLVKAGKLEKSGHGRDTVYKPA